MKSQKALKAEKTQFKHDAKLYPYSDTTEKIIGCAIEVHKTLGPGFKESTYENALIRELKQSGLKVEQQKSIVVQYKGAQVGKHRLDLLIADTIVVELKSAKDFYAEDIKRLISYLKASHKRIGLLINFAKPTIEVKRLIVG